MEMRSSFIELTFYSHRSKEEATCQAIFPRLSWNLYHRLETAEPEEVRSATKQAYCSLPSEKPFRPDIAVMLQKSIAGCQTGQNAISVQSVREITLAERSATVPRDCSSSPTRERRVNAFPTSLIPVQHRATSGHGGV